MPVGAAGGSLRSGGVERAPVQAREVYLRQLLAGRDFAVGDAFAAQMLNFAYALGDRRTGEALLVDPAWAADELVGIVEADGMRVVGVLATHHHADHVGGELAGHRIGGVAQLMQRVDVPVHVNRRDLDAVRSGTGLGSELVGHDGGDTVEVGRMSVRLLHTPGHTRGSQCFLFEGMVVSGDTLFLDGCGRTDLPDSDPADMWDSLQRLAALPDGTAVLPGHRYSAPSCATLEAVRRDNVVYRPTSREDWLAAFSAG